MVASTMANLYSSNSTGWYVLPPCKRALVLVIPKAVHSPSTNPPLTPSYLTQMTTSLYKTPNLVHLNLLPTNQNATNYHPGIFKATRPGTATCRPRRNGFFTAQVARGDRGSLDERRCNIRGLNTREAAVLCSSRIY